MIVTDDWQVDDLALCISRHERYPPEVRPGAIFTVRTVIADMPDLVGGQSGAALNFRDVPDLGPRAAYCARRFRKITPLAPDRFDAEVIDLLAGAKSICS
ncbi:hypothetical protein [Sphingopyxis sp. OAS728]|uniref:hypothetical protein n=1 Tax=Sphingopyxis sp. OAS728 TaxID=2663823 RepID=UPI0017895423|nr:hypothetical protein [Sphingopyxis sp. OAS728]